MGLDITVCRCHTEKCPHCGKPIRDTIRDQVDSCGRVWEEYLEKSAIMCPMKYERKSRNAIFTARI